MPKESALKEATSAAKILQAFRGKIPPSVLADAKGLAIFSGVRGGMYLAGSGGSGVVVARLASGQWSAPAAFHVRSGSVGIVYGFDVYDCIAVLNTAEAVAAYHADSDAGGRVVMGGGISVAAGPLASASVGATPASGPAAAAEKKAVYTYTKSKGLYGGVTVDGTVIKANQKVNDAWYGEAGVRVDAILAGKARAGAWPAGADVLLKTLDELAGITSVVG